MRVFSWRTEYTIVYSSTPQYFGCKILSLRMRLQRYQEVATLARYDWWVRNPVKDTVLLTGKHSNPHFLILRSHFWISFKPKLLVLIETAHPFHPSSFGSPILPNTLPPHQLQSPLLLPPMTQEHFFSFWALPSFLLFYTTSTPTQNPYIHPLVIQLCLMHPEAPLLHHLFHWFSLLVREMQKMQLNLPLCKVIHPFFGLPVGHTSQVFSIVGAGYT